MANPNVQDASETKIAPPKIDQPARDFVAPEKDLKNTGKDGATENKSETGTKVPMSDSKKV